MKKMFLATCLLAASVFAAPQAAAPAPTAAPAKAEAPKAAAPAKAEAPKAAEPAKAEAPKTAEAAKVAPADSAKAPEVAPAAQPAEPAAVPAEQAAAPEAAPADSAKAPEATPAEQAQVAQEKPAVEEKAEPAQEPAKKAKKKKKKKKMIKEAMAQKDKVSFDILADFEMEAGKVFWTSEDDENGDNLETWTGTANFALLAETDDFKGKVAVAFNPGDLEKADENGDTPSDYFTLDEAWAWQSTEYLSFRVGRWDNTDKNGDYFGGYIDGYLAGFLSTQKSENQLQFGFTPTENMEMYLSLISQSANLNKGDLRAAFNFHDLASISDLRIQLAYRSNLFDKVYNSEADVQHNASMKANLPIVPGFFGIFAEAALLDLSDDLVIPITGGISFDTRVVDRIILEAEYINDRLDTPYKSSGKHVKDVLGAIYLEKAFTDRFSLSAGFHSFGSTKDYMLSGNLVGRIN